MKKVLFIMMLGMMFGQTKLETRVYEIELNSTFTSGGTLKSGNSGGSSIELKVIQTRNQIYPSQSKYKINYPGNVECLRPFFVSMCFRCVSDRFLRNTNTN